MVLFNVQGAFEREWQALLCSPVRMLRQEEEEESHVLPAGSQVPALRSRNLLQEDVLTFQLLHSCALLMYQTADIIYKPSNGNNCSHFIISMSS